MPKQPETVEITAKDYLGMADATSIVFHASHKSAPSSNCFYCVNKIDEVVQNWIQQNKLSVQEYFVLGRFGKNQEFLEEDKHCGNFMIEVAIGGEKAYKKDEEGWLRPAYPGSVRILICSRCTEIIKKDCDKKAMSGEFIRPNGWQKFYIQ